VAVVADEPLDAAGHGHVVHGRGAPVPGRERHGHAIAAEVNGGLATGGAVGHPADEPRRGGEVVEGEGLLDAAAVELPARQATEELCVAGGGHGCLLLLFSSTRFVDVCGGS
jgi:hypothetical protein